ncbi:MAG: phosphoenolpyruvate--protein phosphotransferase [Lachnospiraceae bacterium]|nr:phosphoenolpyruvate--protein phosphotransferase [Lachnospiraceae bacterium]
MAKTAQAGIAAARAFITERPGDVPAGDLEKKDGVLLLKEAVESLKQSLLDASEDDDKEKALMLQGQILLLDEPGFTLRAEELVRDQGLDPVSAINAAGKELEEKFLSNDNPYIKGRAADIRGLEEELAARLTGRKREEPNEDVILVGDEISPAFLLQLDRRFIKGIVTGKGSATSHLAVLAGNYGIPYIYGSAEAIQDIPDGSLLLIDGAKLIIDPDDETLKAALKRKEELDALKTSTATVTVKTRTRILANAGSVADVEAAVTAGAPGIGLMRTEFLFLERDTEPSEDEQYEVYSRAAELMGDRELTIRTMDIGADKKASWLPMKDEINPALGCRGSRVSLKFREIFKKQLRALLRAGACGNISIMLPMITSVWELDDALSIISECREELCTEGISCPVPKVGVMIETPAAVMMAQELAGKADFFSIGTNDLAQYAMALDRESEDPGRYEESGLEPLLRLVGLAAKAAHENGIPVCVCGELAGNEDAVAKLIEAGVDRLSVSVSKLEKTRLLAYEAEKAATVHVEKPFDIKAPADGELFAMEEIPDPAFSSGSLGKCIGILPENGSVYAPCDGTVTGIAETGHAITLESNDGRSILIHVGIDTVSLKGKGFDVKVKKGEKVNCGSLLLEADLTIIQNAGLSPMIILSDTG